MAKTEEQEEQEAPEQTVEDIEEQIVNSVTKVQVNKMVKAIQEQDEIIATAAEEKKAIFADLVKKGCDKKSLQTWVDRQTKPPASNKRATATLRALEKITGQTDLFLVK